MVAHYVISDRHLAESNPCETWTFRRQSRQGGCFFALSFSQRQLRDCSAASWASWQNIAVGSASSRYNHAQSGVYCAVRSFAFSDHDQPLISCSP